MIELGNACVLTSPEPITGVQGMVLDSVGPFHHAVRVPFHDSQARGKVILIRTGWDEVQSTEPGPYLHEELIFRLIRAKVRLVGVDFGGVDCSKLIANNVVVVQNLAGLKALPKVGFLFSAEPSGRAFADVYR